MSLRWVIIPLELHVSVALGVTRGPVQWSSQSPAKPVNLISPTPTFILHFLTAGWMEKLLTAQLKLRGKTAAWMQLQLLCFPSVQLGGRGRAAASQRRWMGGRKRPTERKKRGTAGRGREKCMAAHIASDRVTDEGVDTFHSGRSLSTCLHDPSKTPVTHSDGQNHGSRKYSLFKRNISLKWPQCRAR